MGRQSVGHIGHSCVGYRRVSGSRARAGGSIQRAEHHPANRRIDCMVRLAGRLLRPDLMTILVAPLAGNSTTGAAKGPPAHPAGQRGSS